MGSKYTPEMVGEIPRRTCKNSGRNASAPNMAKPAANPMPAQTEKTGLRNRRSGSTGSAARRSARHHAAASTTARMPRPMMTGEAPATRQDWGGSFRPLRHASYLPELATSAIDRK
jgi:hypothetical protein